jgi:NYN domain
MGTRGIKTFSRSLRYRNQSVRLSDGTFTTILVGQEKGVDIRIALDVVRLARENRYDVVLIFSQDQYLSERESSRSPYKNRNFCAELDTSSLDRSVDLDGELVQESVV